MQHLFSRPRALERIVRSRSLVAFDFDGTLAPIVAERETARLRPRTRQLLAELNELYPSAVISGRNPRDLARQLNGALPAYVVGNHGIALARRQAQFQASMTRVRGSLRSALRGLSGVDIENNIVSLALHYRHAKNKRLARARIREAILELDQPVRIVPGKLVVNVLPAGAPHKGDALLEIRRRARAHVALYVGDDVTDEDAFRLREPQRLLTIRVGRSQSSAADYYLRDQREIDRLLSTLIERRCV